MFSDESSGDVNTLRQTASAGTGMPPASCEPNSARHNNTFIVTQNKATAVKIWRENMAACYGAGRYNDCPIRSFCGTTPGLAAINASNFTPLLRAIEASVSLESTL